jgi:hypothetical protein
VMQMTARFVAALRCWNHAVLDKIPDPILHAIDVLQRDIGLERLEYVSLSTCGV